MTADIGNTETILDRTGRPARVCPYCGHELVAAGGGGQGGKRPAPEQCPSCGGLQEPLSRQASQNAMGPWFIRDAANPFRPGCNFETLRMLIERGRVNAATVIRGPTTGQFWRVAASVPGVANLLGACHACRAGVGVGEAACRKCGASFEVPEDRQRLGIGPVRLLPGQATPQAVANAAMGGGGAAARASGAPAGPVELEPREPEEIRVEQIPEPASRSSPSGVRATLSPENKAAKLRRIEQVEAEARMLLNEQRAREQGRVRIVGAAIGLLLLLIAVAALLILPQIMGGVGGGSPAGAAGVPAIPPPVSNP